MEDNYKTRFCDKFSIQNRKCETAIVQPKILTHEDFLFYIENGFLIKKNFFNKIEIDNIRNECFKIYDNSENYFINMEPFSDKKRSILNIHNNKIISSFIEKSDIPNIGSYFLGDDIYIHQSRINYKYGGNTNGWNWHSDFETWHAKDGMPNMKCLTFIIPLDNNTEDNGCVKFIPKTHNYFISCPKIGDVNPEEEFAEQKEGVPSDEIIDKLKKQLNVEEVNVICELTDLVIFDCNLLHGSSENKTNSTRANMYVVMNSLKNKLVDPFNDINPRPEAMGIRKNMKTFKLI